MNNLESLSVKELNSQELQEVTGGGFLLFLGMVALGFLWRLASK